MPNAIGRFVDQYKNTFDLSTVFSDELKTMEEEFDDADVYKYYSAERRGFFQIPQVRFTQKGNALNDPFELTRRWEKFGTPPTFELVSNYVREPVVAMMNTPTLVLEAICDELAEKCIPFDRAFIAARLNSSEGRDLLAKQAAQTEVMVKVVMQALWEEWNARSDEMIERVIKTMGILSLSTTPTSQPMWGLYASSGSGFVVHFRARHGFFRGAPSSVDKSLLRRVHYRNQRVPEFWSNPYYLFAVKETEWAFEKEVRLIKKLVECKEVGVVNGIPIFVQDVVPGMIESIIFGYNYDKASMQDDMRALRDFDAAIRFEQSAIDLGVSRITIQPVEG